MNFLILFNLQKLCQNESNKTSTQTKWDSWLMIVFSLPNNLLKWELTKDAETLLNLLELVLRLMLLANILNIKINPKIHITQCLRWRRQLDLTIMPRYYRRYLKVSMEKIMEIDQIIIHDSLGWNWCLKTKSLLDCFEFF